MGEATSASTLAVVTGAARGIGRAIAARLAADGFRVVATDIDTAELEATAAALGVQAATLDVCDRDAVSRLFDRLGTLGVVVNNAGIASHLVAFRDLTRADLMRMVAVNAHGPFVVSQEAVRRMPEGGRIINIASRGYLGGAGASHYVASKAALVGLTRAMAIELRWAGITVNAVAPGMVDTRMIDGFTPAMRRSLEAREPSGGPADPALIAGCVAFLASPDAQFVNGQVLLCDGGKSVGMPPL